MLSDHEQRVLAELERCCAMEALEPDRPSRRAGRQGRPGSAAGLVLGALSFALLIAGVAVAGLAVATATAIGWLFWRAWSLRADGGGHRSIAGARGRLWAERTAKAAGGVDPAVPPVWMSEAQ